MTFTWTADLAARTPPFRGDGAPIKTKKIDALKLLGPVATSLAPLRAPEYKPRESLVALATTGKGSFADEADAIVILGSTGVSGPYKGGLTVVSPKDRQKVVFAAVDRLVGVYGLVDAFEIVTMIGLWTPYALLTIIPTVFFARDRIRQWLAHHADYDAVLEKAKKLSGTPGFLKQYTNASGYSRANEALAYMFPDHRPFFHGALEQLEASKDTKSAFLVASVASVADMTRLAPKASETDIDKHALVIARSLKEDGISFLADLAHRSYPEEEDFALALTAYASADAARALAKLLERKPLHKIIAGYFGANPALAKEALGPLETSTDKTVRDGAKKILAAI